MSRKRSSHWQSVLQQIQFAKMALEKLTELHGCEMHSTHIPTAGDEAGFRKLRWS